MRVRALVPAVESAETERAAGNERTHAKWRRRIGFVTIACWRGAAIGAPMRHSIIRIIAAATIGVVLLAAFAAATARTGWPRCRKIRRCTTKMGQPDKRASLPASHPPPLLRSRPCTDANSLILSRSGCTSRRKPSLLQMDSEVAGRLA